MLRKVLIAVVLMSVGIVGWVYHRDLTQKVEEIEEDFGNGKKPVTWTRAAVVEDVLKGNKARVGLEGGYRTIVCLAGVDAPEMPENPARPGQPLAIESRQYLAGLIKNKAVEMSAVGVGSDGCPLVLLALDGALVNAKVAEAGLAEVNRGNIGRIPARLRHAIENAEWRAQKSRFGIWGLSNYVRPVEYRIRHRTAG